MSLAEAMQAVVNTRRANEDVFLWPGVVWDANYVHEEVCEFMRVVQLLTAPGHTRSTSDTELALPERLHIEWGQALMMLFTLGYEAGIINPDYALDMALAKIDRVSARRRAEKAQ